MTVEYIWEEDIVHGDYSLKQISHKLQRVERIHGGTVDWVVGYVYKTGRVWEGVATLPKRTERFTAPDQISAMRIVETFVKFHQE